MNLTQSNIPFLVLNVNLKSGLIFGSLGISLVTGAITLANNYSEINQKVKESLNPVISFIEPHFKSLQEGAIKISSTTLDWATSLRDKPEEIWDWLQSNLEISKITSGATQIKNTLKSWYPLIKSFLSSAKDWTENLNSQTLKDYLKSIYTTVNAIYTLIDQFTTVFGKIFEKLQQDPKGVNAENSMLGSIISILKSENNISTLQNLAKTFIDNSNRLSDLGMEDIAAVLGMASNQTTTFNQKIEELSNTANSSSETTEKWGSYSSKTKFLEALGLQHAAQKAQMVQNILKITECPKGSDCGSNYDKILTDFFESIKQKIQSLSIDGSESVTNDFSVDKYFEASSDGTENKVKKIIDKLLELATSSSKQ